MKCANASTKCRSGSGSASQRLVKQNEFDLLAPLYRLTPNHTLTCVYNFYGTLRSIFRQYSFCITFPRYCQLTRLSCLDNNPGGISKHGYEKL